MKTNDSKLRLHTRFALVVLVIGVALTIRQMYAESEPGAIPLLLILCGVAWYLVARFRLRSAGLSRPASDAAAG